MANKFLITGLPRSRTAWMAAFMQCPHEPTALMNSRQDMYDYYQVNQGASDSGMGFWLDWILRVIGVRTVIIDRPLSQVEASLAALNLPVPATDYCSLLKQRLDACRKHPLVMSVAFDSLSDIATMRRIFWHLQPGKPFDEGLFLSMRNQKIVVDPAKLDLSGALYATEISPLLSIANA